MNKLLAHTAVALFIGAAAFAQEAQQPQQEAQQQTQQQEQQQAGAAFVEPTEDDVFATHLMGVAVFAAAEGGAGAPGQGGAIDSAELADFVNVGQVTDVMLGMDGEPRGLIVALTTTPAGQAVDTDATPAPQADPAARAPDQAPGTGPGAPADGMGPMAVAREVAVSFEQVAIYFDQNAPDILFAVVGASPDEMHQAPIIQRAAGGLGMGAGVAGTGPIAGHTAEPATRTWMMGRDPIAAPGVAADGWQPVPVAEVPLDDLRGAPVYGTENEQIGSIGDVRLGPDGTAEYVLVDVGGFLGIGAREVAIGFDEMTVLHDEGWQELQVHVAATREDLERMPEYEQN
jgi:hypothetical protein